MVKYKQSLQVANDRNVGVVIAVEDKTGILKVCSARSR